MNAKEELKSLVAQCYSEFDIVSDRIRAQISKLKGMTSELQKDYVCITDLMKKIEDMDFVLNPPTPLFMVERERTLSPAETKEWIECTESSL